MNALYPKIEPHAQGMHDVGDSNLVYWEVCGDPRGEPAVVLHGGPASGCVPGWRRYFNPAAFRVLLFDQRGCGRSVPHASDPGVRLCSWRGRLPVIDDAGHGAREPGIRDVVAAAINRFATLT